MAEDLEKLPVEGRMNRPESGAYGEKVDVERLKQSLPSTMAGAAGPGQPAPQQPRSGQNLRPAPADPITGSAPLARTPGGVPPLLARPTDYPNRPVGTPMGPPQPSPPAAATAQQQRLAVLDAMLRSPNVSQETKEWATLVRQALLGG